GAGVLLVTADNPFGGIAAIEAGALLVAGTLPARIISVETGAVLGGTGTVGAFLASGTVSPGVNRPGQLRGGGGTLGSGTLRIELNGPFPGFDYDQLIVDQLRIGGTSRLDVTLSFQPAVGQQFRIVQTTTQPDVFPDLPDGAVFAVSGRPFRINYDATGIVLTRVQAATTTTVAASVNPSVFGQSVTFTAVVRSGVPSLPVPQGPVDFSAGTTLPGTATPTAAGEATLTTAALPAGAHPITAVYVGQGDFLPSTSAAVTQTVAQAATAVSAPISFANPSVFGQHVTF